MKIGVIGLGDIARKAYLPVLTQWPDLELVFCTRNADTLQQLARTHRIQDAVT
ncbi:MAG: gfo/Idh/MocA family oxidoreductase, partial [Photobacterium halotolerans]